MCIGGQHGGMWVEVCIPSRACVCVSICDTYNAAGPHSPSGMWDFQVQNRPHRGRRAGTNSREEGEAKEKKKKRRMMMSVFIATKAESCLSF